MSGCDDCGLNPCRCPAVLVDCALSFNDWQSSLDLQKKTGLDAKSVARELKRMKHNIEQRGKRYRISS